MLKLFLLIAAISISYQKRGPLWKIENKSDLDDILFKNISSHAIKYMMLAANHSIQAIEKLGLLSDALETRMKETEELIDEENRAQEEMAKQCLAEKMVQQSCFMCYQEKCLEILQNCESEKDDLTAGAYKTMGKHEPFNRKKSFDIGAMVLSVTETVTSTDKQKTTILELEKFVEEDPVITYFNNLYKELMQEETEWIKQGITEDDVDYRNDVNFDPRDIFDYDYQYEVYEESFES
ncbi:uncharacterized protein LOC134855925, partial [Symsagittifera roscoffensis]|uniref:uncharacterized protein LOC134855925 n=1 Tax=Symsagittifera roscoffensis TaxID=84072 RepID=UPI00307BA83B